MTWPIVPPGVWLSVRAEPCDPPRPALFLDRDGVVIEDVGFIGRASDVALLPGAAALIAKANAAGIPVVVVTNQSGIDRALLSWEDFSAVEDEISRQFALEGGHIDAVAACPFHPAHTPGYGPTHDKWRKPKGEMIREMARRLNIAVGASWLVGDRIRDQEAAQDAGLDGAVLLQARDAVDAAAAPRLAGPDFEVSVHGDLGAVSAIVLPKLIPARS